MRCERAALFAAGVLALSMHAYAAEVVHPDAVVHLARDEPTHRLVETSLVNIPYGEAIGFVPGGNQREAQGPYSFAIDPDGGTLITDSVHKDIKRVEIRSGVPVVSSTGATGLPSFPIESRVRVVKCNPEAGLVTLPGDKKIQIEIDGPLASIRQIGTNAAGDTFLLVERFLERGKLAVDRQIVVLDAIGSFKARLEVVGRPAVRPVREFAIGPRGALHRMVAGNTGVTLVKWEVRR